MYQALNINNTPAGVSFTVNFNGELLGQLALPVIGTHNAINALSVVALLHALGKTFEEIALGLSRFTGTKRRMEIKGATPQGAQVIDDYAHHPVEVRATLTALEATYPDKKIVCIFQPHTFSRTQSLASEFAHSFEGIHHLILLPIFASAREGAVDQSVQKKLYEKIFTHTPGTYIENSGNVIEYCTQNYVSDEYIIVTMGAGDVYKIGEKLIQI
jgi:UDP-N-acetylmuramate--alanine ligase